MGDHEDAGKLILKYCPKSPPEWQLPSAYNHCRHCEDKFKGKSHQHNCRLCGHLFCSMCTKKYHIPQDFKRKDKAGTVRVCLGCRDQALIRRQRSEDTPVLRPHQEVSVQKGKVHIHPPTWVSENAYNHCFECRESTGAHPFFCRLCGEMFCTKCSVKLDVPDGFRRKRNKTGPVRCCIECRYKVYAKVELDETPIKHVQAQEKMQFDEYQMSYDQEGGRPQTIAGSMAQFAPRIPNSPLKSSELAARISAPPRTLQVYERHNPHDFSNPGQFLAQIEVPGDSNLVEINERVMKSCSTLKGRLFYFVCRNKPIYREHWDIFSMKYFPEVIVVQGAPPGETEESYSRAIREGQQRSPPSQQQQMPAGDSGPPPPNFPGSRASTDGGFPTRSQTVTGAAMRGPAGQQPHRMSVASNGSLPNRANTMGAGPGPAGVAGRTPVSSAHSIPGGPPGPPGAAAGGAMPGPPGSKPKRQLKYADAIWVKSEFDYEAQTETNMTIRAGQVLACFAHDPKEQWWFGESLDEQKKGWFPAAYVKECEAPHEGDDGMPKGGAGGAGAPPPFGGAAAGGPPPAPAAAAAGGPPGPPMAAMRAPSTTSSVTSGGMPPAAPAAAGPPPPPGGAGGPPPAPGQAQNPYQPQQPQRAPSTMSSASSTSGIPPAAPAMPVPPAAAAAVPAAAPVPAAAAAPPPAPAPGGPPNPPPPHNPYQQHQQAQHAPAQAGQPPPSPGQPTPYADHPSQQQHYPQQYGYQQQGGSPPQQQQGYPPQLQQPPPQQYGGYPPQQPQQGGPPQFAGAAGQQWPPQGQQAPPGPPAVPSPPGPPAAPAAARPGAMGGPSLW